MQFRSLPQPLPIKGGVTNIYIDTPQLAAGKFILNRGEAVKLQAKAFSLSMAIHAFVFACIIAAGVIVPKQKTLVLDFSIGSRVAAAQGVQQKKQPVMQREQKIVTPLADDEKAVPVQQEQQQEIPAPATRQAQGEQSELNNATTTGDSGEAAKTHYLSAQFLSIRDKIMRSLVYPLVARKMGWAGKVKVAFTVREDGNVEDLSVIESSGFSVLDKNAIETIRKCCPLPRPPVKVALIMPVVYRLE